jgi:hypothetical protein
MITVIQTKTIRFFSNSVLTRIVVVELTSDPQHYTTRQRTNLCSLYAYRRWCVRKTLCDGSACRTFCRLVAAALYEVSHRARSSHGKSDSCRRDRIHKSSLAGVWKKEAAQHTEPTPCTSVDVIHFHTFPSGTHKCRVSNEIFNRLNRGNCRQIFLIILITLSEMC